MPFTYMIIYHQIITVNIKYLFWFASTCIGPHHVHPQAANTKWFITRKNSTNALIHVNTTLFTLLTRNKVYGLIFLTYSPMQY